MCAWNIKHSPSSDSLSLIPSLTVGNCSHHRLPSIRRTVHTSVKCQPTSSLSLFLPGSLFALLSMYAQTHHQSAVFSPHHPCSFSFFVSSAFRHPSDILFVSLPSLVSSTSSAMVSSVISEQTGYQTTL